MLFSIVAILFYTPTSSTHGIQFLRIFTDTCYFLICFVLIVAILMGVKWVQCILTNVYSWVPLPQSRWGTFQSHPKVPSLTLLCRYVPLTSPLPPVSDSRQPLLCFLALYISLVFLASFTQNNVLEIHLCYHCVSRLLKSTPLHEYSAICLSIYLLMGIWVVTSCSSLCEYSSCEHSCPRFLVDMGFHLS